MSLRIRGIIVALVLGVVGPLLLGTLQGCGQSRSPAADFEATRDGYSFENSIDLDTRDDFEVWSLVYGDGDTSRWAYDTFVRRRGGHGVFSSGLCYGMVGTVLSLFNGWTEPSDFSQEPAAREAYSIDPGAHGSQFGGARPALRRFVERYHIVQYAKGVAAKSNYRDARAAFLAVRKAVEDGNRRFPILIVSTQKEHRGGPAGHALLPVGLGKVGKNDVARILIWDTNHPGVLRPLWISTKTWAWSYDMTDAKGTKRETWTSRHGHLGHVAIQDVVNALDDSPGGSRVGDAGGGGVSLDVAPMTVVTGADAVFRGSGDGVLGFVHGDLRDTLPGAGYVYPDALTGRSGGDVFIVPTGAEIARAVTSRGGGVYGYAVITAAGGAEITGQPGSGNTDVLEVGRGAASVAITPRQRERACSLSLARFVDGQARLMTVEPSDLSAQETFIVAAADRNQAVRVTNTGRARTYAVTLSCYGEPGSFVSSPMSIGAGETQTIKAYDWNDLAASRIDLFTGPAGAADGSEVRLLRDGEVASTPFPYWVAGVVAGLMAVGLAVLVSAKVRRHRRSAG